MDLLTNWEIGGADEKLGWPRPRKTSLDLVLLASLDDFEAEIFDTVFFNSQINSE